MVNFSPRGYWRLASSEWRVGKEAAGPLTTRYSLLAIRYSQRFRRLEHLGGMTVDLHIRPDVGDAAVRADQEGRANNAHEALAIHRFLRPRPVGRQHVVGLVGEKSHCEVVLLLEGLLRLHGV